MVQERNAIRIMTDTTAALPEEYLQERGAGLIHQVIIFGNETFLEEAELSYTQFLDRLRTSPVLPKTAAPPVPEAAAMLEALLREAQTVLCIHPSTDLSGTVRSVETAKANFFPEADIRVLDTRAIGGALGSMVRCAVEWAEAGVSADTIMQRLHSMIPRARTYFLVDTLEFLRRGGRIGGAASLLGNALRIKPILHLTDGRINAYEKVRTRSRALKLLADIVALECPRNGEAHLTLMHADAPESARWMAQALRDSLGLREIPLVELGAAITTHAGPGTLGVSFFAAATGDTEG